MSEDKNFDAEDVLFDSFVNWMFSSATPEFVARLKSLDKVDRLVKSLETKFVDSLCDQYQQEGVQAMQHSRRTKENRAGFTLTRLGKRYMTNNGNVSRWLNESQRFSFETFCMVSAAEDLEYPSGHVIALSAYEEAIQHAAKSLGCDIAISAQDYLAVYHLFRLQAMLPRHLIGDPALIEKLTSTAIQRTAAHFPRTNYTTPIGQTAERIRLPFIIICKALPYGWF